MYVQSRGNRGGRPLYPEPRMAETGCVACIDAIVYLTVSFHFMKRLSRRRARWEITRA